MQTWPELHRELNRLDVGNRRQAAERESFERWCAIAEDRVLSALAARAASRARELEVETGAHIRVSTSGTAPSPSGPGFSRVRVLTLELGSSRVDVYSVRATAESPSIHLGVLRGATTTRHPVLAALPGCLVVRRSDGGFDLLLPPSPLAPSLPSAASPAAKAPGDRRTTSIDALVLRAFELLVGAHRSTRASAGAS